MTDEKGGAVAFFDVDGTLVWHDAEKIASGEYDFSAAAPTPAVYEAFRRLHAAGHRAFICTGRPVPFILDSLRALEPDGYIAAAGAVPVLYLGEWFTSGGLIHIFNFLFLWVGVSALTNLFPQTEDALTLKDLLYGKQTRPNLFLRILVSPVFAVLYAGSYLQKWGVTLLSSAAFAYLYPYLLAAFLPQLYNALR